MTLRLLLRSALVLLLVLVFLLMLLPLTEIGTRWLLSRLVDYAPISIDYESGTLLGELRFHRVALSLDAVDLQLDNLDVAFNAGCLWNSRICLTTLAAGKVQVHVKNQEQSPGASMPDISDDVFEFPVAVSARHFVIDTLHVTWPGGFWRNQQFTGALNMAGKQLQFDHVLLTDAHLNLADDAAAVPAESPLALPDVELPFKLVIDALALERGSYAVYGQKGTLQSLTLAGEWSQHTIALERLSVATDQVVLNLDGALRMRESWWLQAQSALTLTRPNPEDPLAINRMTLNLEGALSQLGWEAVLDSAQATPPVPGLQLQANGEINATLALLPFNAQLQAQWPGILPVEVLLPGVTMSQQVALRSPVLVSVTGDIERQRFQLEAGASGFGYDAMAVVMRAAMASSELTLESLTLDDAGTDSSLFASGAVQFGEGVDLALELRSSGLELPQTTDSLAGRVSGSLAVQGSFLSEQWQLSIDAVDVEGVVNELPAQIMGALSLSSEQPLASADLRGALNGAALRLSLEADTRAPGKLDLQVDDIGLWVPGARGRLVLNATGRPGDTRVAFTGAGEQLGFGSSQMRAARFSGALALDKKWFETFSLEATQIEFAGQQIESGQVELLHQPASGVDTLSIRTRGDIGLALELAGKGDLNRWEGSLQSTELALPQGQWRLEHSTALRWEGSDSQLTIDPHCWLESGVAVCIDNAGLGPRGTVAGRVNGGMGFLADLLPQQVTIDGVLKGRFNALWAPQTVPSVQADLAATDIVITQELGSGQVASLAWDSAVIDFKTGADAASFQLQIQRSGQKRLGVEASLSGWTRDSRINGTLETNDLRLAALRPFVPRLAEFEGQLDGRGRLGGTLGKPELVGAFALEQGSIAVVGNPTLLSELSLNLNLTGRDALLEGNGRVGEGTLMLSGNAALDPELSVTLNMKGERQSLLFPPSGGALVSQDLTLTANGTGVGITGQITVHEGRLEHEQLPEGSVDVSPDVVEVDYAGNVLREERVFDLTMDVGVQIEDKFRVLGTNIDTTVGGDLRLRQRSDEPLVLYGNLIVIGGELRAYGQSLRVKQGTISFAGAPDNPQLDLRAERDITLESIRVGVHVIGPLEEPELEIYSEPTMSQTEALSYLIRGRGLDVGAGADGTALAVSMGTSIVNRSGVTESLNKIPGLSNIGFGAEGSEDETAATVSGYIGERIYMSYGVGLYEPINILTARLYLQTRLWLEVVSRLENSFDIYYSFDID